MVDNTQMQNENRRLILLMSFGCGLLVALCISVGVRLVAGHPPGIPVNPLAELIGKPVPDFEVASLNEDRQISSDAIGDSPYILYFTASDCRGCDETYPVLKAASTSLPAFVIGVGHQQTLAKKLKNHEIVATVGFDSSRAVLKTCGIIGVPTALLVNEEGVVREAAMGKPNIAHMFASNLELQ
ncbi:MAG: redoxin domain-containing protein [Gemmatimonadetes bacterium]|nr:redoxin domain-containing protein [Gemmatimonadota bacterium]MYF18272.1 redoxin domain-containing protein [Gemmatimonadota bacterium]